MRDFAHNIQSHSDVSPPHCVGAARKKGVMTYIDPQEDGGAQGQSNFKPVRLIM